MRRQFMIGGLLLLGALVVAALLIMLRPEPEQTPPADRIPLVQVEPIHFDRGRLNVRGGGTVRPVERVRISPQINGRITYVSPNLIEGRTVRAGELLVRIDNRDFRNSVEQARADVAQQSVSVAQAEEEVRIAQREVERFSEREQRLASRVPASVDRDDFAATILPPRLLESEPQGQVEAVSAPNELASRRPQLRAAQAALAGARAQLADARLGLSRTEIRAPFSAIVATENIGPGSFAAPGQVVAELVAISSLEVLVPLSPIEAALLPGIFRGTRYNAEITYDYGGRLFRWDAYVDRADGMLNEETRTIDVYLRVPDPIRGGSPLATDVEKEDADQDKSAAGGVTAPPLLVGSFVNVSIEGQPRDAYAVVPLSALRAGDRIWTVKDGKVAIRPVSVIQRDDDFAYVEAADIPRDAQLITGGVEIATNGMKVRVAKPDRSVGARPGAKR